MSRTTLEQAMQAAGLAPIKPLKLTGGGKIERFRVEGDKPGSSNGWIVYRDDGVCPSASFGSWKTSETHHWSARDWAQLSAADRDGLRKSRLEAQKLLEAETEALRAKVRAKAALLWGRGKPATNDHAYLIQKGINSYGLRRLGDALLVPMFDTEGTLHSLQFLYGDGRKRFLTGGRTRGCYCPIGKPGKVLLLAEGFATGATLFEATGHAVAVCFSAHNLHAAGAELRRKFPALEFIVCADNDVQTVGNPGLKAAVEAARAVGGRVAVPRLDVKP